MKIYDEILLHKGVVRGDNRLLIKSAYKDKPRVQSMPGSRWDGPLGVWHVPWSPVALAAVYSEFEADRTITLVDSSTKELVEEMEARKVAGDAKRADDLPDLPTKTVGWLHQRRAFHFAKDLTSAGLFLDMGGGKSAVAIGLLDHWSAECVLIMCPKSVMGVWPKQFTLHSPERWRFFVANQAGTVARKANALATFLMSPGRKVVVVNYDAGWRNAMADLLLSWEWDVEILDESHKIKSPGGKASRFATQMRSHCKRVLLLTGTPQPHGPGDIYAQYRAADPGIFGTSFNRHKNQYFATRKINDKVDVIEGFRDDRARAEFARRMGSIAIVIKREDMTSDLGDSWRLPQVERQVALESGTYRVYNELRRELVSEIDAGIVTADNALTRLLRLRQITSGFVKTEDGVENDLSSEKATLLAEVLDDIPKREPVVVFGVFHHDLDTIRRVSQETGRMYAELSGRRRDGIEPDSTLARHADIVGVQLQSGGVGVDFTRSAYGIYFSIDYNLGNIEQSFSRLDRPGQTRPVTFIHLVTTTPTGGRTVDGVTYEAVEKRKKLNEAVIDALREDS